MRNPKMNVGFQVVNSVDKVKALYSIPTLHWPDIVSVRL
jgi:hypothetical protein